VEAVIGADQVEAGLELDTKDALATPYILCGRHPQRDVEDSGVPEDKGEADQVPCLGLKANSSPETWGLSDGDDEEYCEEEGNSVPREQGREFKDGQPAHLSPVLLIRSLQNSDRNTGEEAAEEEGVGHHEGVTEFSYPSPHWEGCPAVEEAEDGETVKKEVPGASPSPISPGFKPSSWVSCPGEKEDQTTEEKGTENKGAREASISPASSGSNPKIWECCLGEASKEKGDTAGEGGDPEPGALVPAQRSLCRAFDCEPSKKNTEKEEEVSALGVAEKEGGAESPSIPLTCASVRAWVFQTGEDTEDEDSDSGSAEKEGEADSSSSTPTTSAFLKAWVYRPGEDTEDEDDEDSDLGSAEEEGETEAPSSVSSTNAFLKAWVYRPGEDTEDEDDEDSDLGSAEEEGETEAPSSIPPTSAFLKAWVYRPGEDKEDEDDEDSDLGSDEEEGETEAPSSTPPTSAFLKAWVYQPGEDTEEEDECEKHEDRLDDSEAGEGGEAADSDSYPSLLDQSIPLRGWICRLGKEAEEEAAIKKRKEAEPCPLQVAIYLPGEKPPPPWAAPKLPLRLQRRLKLSEAPAQVSDPETPLKARKVGAEGWDFFLFLGAENRTQGLVQGPQGRWRL
jgi:protein phosphatase 1 regulatory subunit 15A